MEHFPAYAFALVFCTGIAWVGQRTRWGAVKTLDRVLWALGGILGGLLLVGLIWTSF